MTLVRVSMSFDGVLVGLGEKMLVIVVDFVGEEKRWMVVARLKSG